MKIYLSAIGWIGDEAPKGNRLRWHYPAEAESGDRYLGLPETIIVERAWLKEDLPNIDKIHSGTHDLSGIPDSWWDSIGDVHPLSSQPDIPLSKIFTLEPSVQGVRFSYHGYDTKLTVTDSAIPPNIVFDRMINNGDEVTLQAADICALKIFADNATFHNFRVLDLFRDRGLQWEEIARIRVADTASFPFDKVSLRYDSPPTLEEQEWEDFREAAELAQISTPAEDQASPDEPPKWKVFQMLMAIRWEYAVLFGHGFFDGPRSNWETIDEIKRDLILPDVTGSRAIAYRVREAAGRLGPSNIAVCPPRWASPLIPPGQPIYQDPQVKLTADPESGEPKFVATYHLEWTQPDPFALGVNVEEWIGESQILAAASSALTSRFERVERSKSPPFALVSSPRRTLFERAETTLSPLIPLKAPKKLSYFCRSRQPDDPPGTGLHVRSQEVAFHDVQLRCRVCAVDGWDRTSDFSTYSPWTSLELLHDPVAPPLDSVTWDDGMVSIIRHIGDPDFPDWKPDLVVQHDAGALIYVYRRNLATWDKVAEFGIQGLPDVLTFSDPIGEPTEKADVLSYHTRVAYLGSRVGPPGNTVQVLRMPEIPDPPPPFTVDFFGVDFYNRTMVMITFTNPNLLASDGRYTIWWANGIPTDFAAKAVPGIMRAQTPYQGKYLFDTLAIPLPQSDNRKITIGVQRVTSGEGQSNFVTCEVTLEAWKNYILHPI